MSHILTSSESDTHCIVFRMNGQISIAPIGGYDNVVVKIEEPIFLTCNHISIPVVVKKDIHTRLDDEGEGNKMAKNFLTPSRDWMTLVVVELPNKYIDNFIYFVRMGNVYRDEDDGIPSIIDHRPITTSVQRKDEIELTYDGGLWFKNPEYVIYDQNDRWTENEGRTDRKVFLIRRSTHLEPGEDRATYLISSLLDGKVYLLTANRMLDQTSPVNNAATIRLMTSDVNKSHHQDRKSEYDDDEDDDEDEDEEESDNEDLNRTVSIKGTPNKKSDKKYNINIHESTKNSWQSNWPIDRAHVVRGDAVITSFKDEFPSDFIPGIQRLISNRVVSAMTDEEERQMRYDEMRREAGVVLHEEAISLVKLRKALGAGETKEETKERESKVLKKIWDEIAKRRLTPETLRDPHEKRKIDEWWGRILSRNIPEWQHESLLQSRNVKV